MPGFVSYAQNFEDLMLWRALHGIHDGFYIDVGAADSDEDSVTRAFYDRGWRGVNIEPNPELFAAISVARPRDINLSCLVGRSPGDMQLYRINDTGLSTVKKDLAERHAADGYPVEVIGLPVRTLADICREYAPPDIHFLKIDVEGAEEEVLRGAEFTTYRPWIVLVEATLPNSQVENWEAWDPLLTKADYTFVWFDGLNRFYLAAERVEELGQAFLTPPNVFDYWVRPRGQQQMALLREVHALQAAMDRLRDETTKAGAEANTARAEASTLQAAMDRLREETTKARANLDAEMMVARSEAQAHRAEASALRTAESAARAALKKAQQDVSIARAEMDQLRGIQQARELAEATVAALRASTSWKITAPLRGLSRGLLSYESNPARWQRLRLVTELGQDPAGVKGLARIAVYGLGRFVARTSAGRATARLVHVALPGPYRWLHLRYTIYRNAAASFATMKGDLPPAAESQSSHAPLLSQQQRNLSQQEQNDLSAEEQTMLLRLRAGAAEA